MAFIREIRRVASWWTNGYFMIRNLYNFSATVWVFSFTVSERGAGCQISLFDHHARYVCYPDTKLAETEYVAGEHSVADIAFYADVHIYGPEAIGLADYPNLKRWHDTLEARPAVKKAWGPH